MLLCLSCVSDQEHDFHALHVSYAYACGEGDYARHDGLEIARLMKAKRGVGKSGLGNEASYGDQSGFRSNNLLESSLLSLREHASI